MSGQIRNLLSLFSDHRVPDLNSKFASFGQFYLGIFLVWLLQKLTSETFGVFCYMKIRPLRLLSKNFTKCSDLLVKGTSPYVCADWQQYGTYYIPVSDHLFKSNHELSAHLTLLYTDLSEGP